MTWSPLPTADARHQPEPVPLPELLDQVLGGLGAPAVDAVVTVHERWDEVVGSEVVTHASPVAIEAGCLRVVTDSPAWASHLRWAEADILARLAELIGAGVVTSVKVRVGRS